VEFLIPVEASTQINRTKFGILCPISDIPVKFNHPVGVWRWPYRVLVFIA
jgi:hypothetical protein